HRDPPGIPRRGDRRLPGRLAFPADPLTPVDTDVVVVPRMPAMTSLESIRIPVGPLVFDATTTGPADGEPILLLHGFPQTAECWRRIQPALGDAGLRAVAPDLRGYSPDARPPDPGSYRIEDLVAD